MRKKDLLCALSVLDYLEVLGILLHPVFKSNHIIPDRVFAHCLSD